jgi:hypothetical protein
MEDKVKENQTKHDLDSKNIRSHKLNVQNPGAHHAGI